MVSIITSVLAIQLIVLFKILILSSQSWKRSMIINIVKTKKHESMIIYHTNSAWREIPMLALLTMKGHVNFSAWL